MDAQMHDAWVKAVPVAKKVAAHMAFRHKLLDKEEVQQELLLKFPEIYAKIAGSADYSHLLRRAFNNCARSMATNHDALGIGLGGSQRIRLSGQIWYKHNRKTYYVFIGGKQHNLGSDKKKAIAQYYELSNTPIESAGEFGYLNFMRTGDIKPEILALHSGAFMETIHHDDGPVEHVQRSILRDHRVDNHDCFWCGEHFEKDNAVVKYCSKACECQAVTAANPKYGVRQSIKPLLMRLLAGVAQLSELKAITNRWYRCIEILKKLGYQFETNVRNHQARQGYFRLICKGVPLPACA